METIKNIETIFRLLFQYKEIVLFVIVIFLTVFNAIFSSFITNKYCPKINYNANRKKKISSIFKREKIRE